MGACRRRVRTVGGSVAHAAASHGWSRRMPTHGRPTLTRRSMSRTTAGSRSCATQRRCVRRSACTRATSSVTRRATVIRTTRCPSCREGLVACLCGRSCDRSVVTAWLSSSKDSATRAAELAEGVAQIDGVEVINDVVYTQVCVAVGDAAVRPRSRRAWSRTAQPGCLHRTGAVATSCASRSATGRRTTRTCACRSTHCVALSRARSRRRAPSPRRRASGRT